MQMVLTAYNLVTGWQTPLPTLDSPQTLVLVFGDADITPYQPALDELHIHYPTSVITGCSSMTGILDQAIHERDLVVAIIRFEKTVLKMVHCELAQAAYSLSTGQTLSLALAAPDLTAIILLTDGTCTNGDLLLQGIATHISKKVNIVGGLASNDGRFNKTWVLINGKPYYDMACAIGFYSTFLETSSIARHGWQVFGTKRLVTKAIHNVIYEIDNRPALDLYQQYLGSRYKNVSDFMLYYPLAVWSKDQSYYTVRSVFNTDEEQKTLILGGDIVEGSQLQFMYGYMDSLIEGAEESVITTRQQLPDQTAPLFALAISCAGRRLIMGDETEQEVTIMMEQYPPGSHQIGFYSYGELAPIQPQGRCYMHNETMTLMLMYERHD